MHEFSSIRHSSACDSFENIENIRKKSDTGNVF
jgi:hypothetical protein